MNNNEDLMAIGHLQAENQRLRAELLKEKADVGKLRKSVNEWIQLRDDYMKKLEQGQRIADDLIKCLQVDNANMVAFIEAWELWMEEAGQYPQVWTDETYYQYQFCKIFVPKWNELKQQHGLTDKEQVE